MKRLLIMIVSTTLASCALAPISGTRTGESVDLLRDSEKITVVSGNEKSLKISVVTKSGQTCSGDFKYIESATGMPYVPTKGWATNTYRGKFTPGSADCKEALGDKTGMEVTLEHKAPASIFGLGDEWVVTCKSNGSTCWPTNTFELD